MGGWEDGGAGTSSAHPPRLCPALGALPCGRTVSSLCPLSTKDASSEPRGGFCFCHDHSQRSPSPTTAGGLGNVCLVQGHRALRRVTRAQKAPGPRLYRQPGLGDTRSTHGSYGGTLVQHPSPAHWLAGEGSPAHLVDFVPAILVFAAHGRVLVEQQLTAAGVAPDHRRMIQWGQAVAVLVIRGCAKLQEGLEKKKKKTPNVRSLVSWPLLQE